MPHHTPDALMPDQVRKTSRTLVELATYLRTYPPVEKAVPLLVPLLDEDSGAPILLGDILRSAARLVSQQAARPMADETRQIIDSLREAAQEITDWHVLHWDVQRLSAMPGEFAIPAPEDQ
ncbi:hypothetical protein ACFRQM_18925 [Streptomyces sp. NPDC056831]|uniref:hypothetical protein n=1 Tax=Streptomyces sp. NPDC056831 TaxID=3345954 RepID=UPI0036A7F63E